MPNKNQQLQQNLHWISLTPRSDRRWLKRPRLQNLMKHRWSSGWSWPWRRQELFNSFVLPCTSYFLSIFFFADHIQDEYGEVDLWPLQQGWIDTEAICQGAKDLICKTFDNDDYFEFDNGDDNGGFDGNDDDDDDDDDDDNDSLSSSDDIQKFVRAHSLPGDAGFLCSPWSFKPGGGQWCFIANSYNCPCYKS